MLAEAQALVGAPYTWGGGHGSTFESNSAVFQFGVDCSGFVSKVLKAGGVNLPSPQTTSGLPNYLAKGIGSVVTVYDRSTGPDAHTIIDIGGQWFGAQNSSTGVVALSQSQAEATLDSGGFTAYHPIGTATGKNMGRATALRTGTNSTLAQLWVQAGGSPGMANTMAAIAMAESGGRTNATNKDSNGSTDYGLWQINSGPNGAHPQYDTQKLLNDPLYNARAAVAVYKSSGLGAWTTYTSGAYQAFLGNASSSTTVNYGGPNGGIVRPGGSSASEDVDLTSAVNSLDSPRTAPADYVSLSGDILGTFSWYGQEADSAWHSFKEALNAPAKAFGDVSDVVGESIKILDLLPWYFLRWSEFMTGITLMGIGFFLSVRGTSGRTGTQSGPASAVRTIVGYTPVGREMRIASATRAGRREGQTEHYRLAARRQARAEEAAKNATN